MTVLAFEVTLNRAASSATVTVDYATADGTATAGADYTAASGTLTFDPGETAKTVDVTVLDDAHDDDRGDADAHALERVGGADPRRRGDGHDRELGPDPAGVAGALRAHGGGPRGGRRRGAADGLFRRRLAGDARRAADPAGRCG